MAALHCLGRPDWPTNESTNRHWPTTDSSSTWTRSRATRRLQRADARRSGRPQGGLEAAGQCGVAAAQIRPSPRLRQRTTPAGLPAESRAL